MRPGEELGARPMSTTVYDLFEQRMSDAMRAAMPGEGSPFPLRKVARAAVKAMRRGRYRSGDALRAPALYTLLVCPADYDATKRCHARLANELSLLVEAQADEGDISLVGKPLARVVSDNGLRPGRFAVIADNVDQQTLTRLRGDEERLRGGGQQRQEQQQVRTPGRMGTPDTSGSTQPMRVAASRPAGRHAAARGQQAQARRDAQAPLAARHARSDAPAGRMRHDARAGGMGRRA